MTDKAGRPYIEHPRQVMDRMGTDVERMVAVLHDVLEDTLVTVDELLGRGCPPEVIEAIEALTKRQGENYVDFIKRTRDSGNELAVPVKLADIADNTRRGGSVTARWPDGAAMRGIVEIAEPARRLAFRWRQIERGEAGFRLWLRNRTRYGPLSGSLRHGFADSN